LSVGLAVRLFRQRVIRVRKDAIGRRAHALECAQVVLDHRVRHDLVVLRFDDEHVAGERLACRQRPVVARADQCAAVSHEIGPAQLPLGRQPFAIAVERRRTQREPAHWPHGADQRRQVAAVAAAHDGNGAGIDRRVADERVIGCEHVAQVVLASDLLAQRSVARMAAQVEGQADAAERRDFVSARNVLLLAAIPAMDQENAGHHGGGGNQRSGNVLTVYRYVYEVMSGRCHTAFAMRIW
jgi:hypothetical protein